MALPLLSGGARIFCVRCPSPSSREGRTPALRAAVSRDNHLTKGDRRSRPSTGGCSRQCESLLPASNCHHDDVIRGPEISHLKAALLLFPAHICSLRGMPTDLSTSLPRGVDVEVWWLTTGHPHPHGLGCLPTKPALSGNPIRRDPMKSSDGSFERVTQVDHTT